MEFRENQQTTKWSTFLSLLHFISLCKIFISLHLTSFLHNNKTVFLIKWQSKKSPAFFPLAVYVFAYPRISQIRFLAWFESIIMILDNLPASYFFIFLLTHLCRRCMRSVLFPTTKFKNVFPRYVCCFIFNTLQLL